MSYVPHDSETPAKGQQVITAVAFIHADFDGITKVFLPKRADTKKFLPSVFEMPGGHIDFGEEIVDGLQREIDEEFGMKVAIGEIFGAFTYTNEIKGSHSAELIYFAEFIDPIEQIKIDPEDHSEFRWVAENELDTIYSDQKGEEDIEYKYVKKGFSLLKTKVLGNG
jgi:8-oxo-dGTP diphosphatase